MVLVAAGGAVLWQMAADPAYREAGRRLLQGVRITVVVSVVAYAGAAALGLGLALAGRSRWLVLRQAARLWVEVVRGVPILVLLLYTAFVAVPALVAGWNGLRGWMPGLPELATRDVPFLWRAVAALMLAYSAFLAEIFRAGLASVPQGQVEAAEALGLTAAQRFRLVVLPQAIRVILPPLGNDFVAMVKDSSLVSILGVADVSQIAKVTAAGNFRYFETYNVVAVIYLALTIGLSLALRRLEVWLRRPG